MKDNEYKEKILEALTQIIDVLKWPEKKKEVVEQYNMEFLRWELEQKAKEQKEINNENTRRDKGIC